MRLAEMAPGFFVVNPDAAVEGSEHQGSQKYPVQGLFVKASRAIVHQAFRNRKSIAPKSTISVWLPILTVPGFVATTQVHLTMNELILPANLHVVPFARMTPKTSQKTIAEQVIDSVRAEAVQQHTPSPWQWNTNGRGVCAESASNNW
jgi:hypothetical protein